ncbi:DUF4382 domain-containing protein [Geomonas sp. RF6]|uniref:DUF4382 domain-containing protein n=1 Tax=Geomonas sp. RF6 TaxID=2897342 RepID=UPI001E56EC9F|nr:DUF4382 domain-containing protein [Geomonas sp. RF6]UFS68993.1 DUF4382 domain-containing protein [Geomonas sp. RF6]
MSRKVRRMWGVVGLFLVAALVLAQLPGCGGGGSGSTAAVGTLKVSLTDKQSDTFANVFIAIKEVRVVPPGLENAPDNDSRLPVVVTYDTPHVVDVLTLRFQQELLGSIPLPAGTYNQVRLILAPNPSGQADPVNYLTLKTAPTVKVPLTTPSAQQSGLKVLGNFEVKAGVINAIVLDFDPNTAIVARGNGAYNLKPTGIRIIQTSASMTSFGALSGTVVSTSKDWSSATVSVVPQGGVNPIAAGTIFSNFSSNRWEGPFTAFVPGGSYRVHVTAAGFAPYSSPLQTVTTGTDTSLGDILLLTP